MLTFEGATGEQAYAILAAANQVVQSIPVSTDLRSGRGDGVVIAAGRALFTPPVDVDPAALPRIGRHFTERKGLPEGPSLWRPYCSTPFQVSGLDFEMANGRRRCV